MADDSPFSSSNPTHVADDVLNQAAQTRLRTIIERIERLEVDKATVMNDIKEVFAEASVLVMQLETPIETIQTAAELASKSGVRVILNPAPARALPDSLLRHVSIITPNETEAELLTGIKVDSPAAAKEAADKLIARGIETVIMTLGSRGAFVASGAISELVAGFIVEAVDTTAAGDTFNGALAVALAEGQTLDQAVRFANAAAAISVTRIGAQPSAPKREEIENFLRTSVI